MDENIYIYIEREGKNKANQCNIRSTSAPAIKPNVTGKGIINADVHRPQHTAVTYIYTVWFGFFYNIFSILH